MTALGILVLLAAVVAGAVWFVSERRRRDRAARRESLEDFLTTLRTETEAARSDPESELGVVLGSPRRDRTTETVALGGAAAAGTRGRDGDGQDRPTRFRVEHPEGLPTFADVGGMQNLLSELRETVGLVLEHRDRAEAYGIEWNGLLLHGPPGSGKTHIVRAMAGEFGCSLLHLSTGDLVSGIAGESAKNVARAFDAADGHRPCVLFFDEFDAIAQRRDAGSHPEERRVVTQLLRSLEEHRDGGDLLVVAATNDYDHLDPAVVRAGRFDRHIRVDLPDLAARRAILEVHLDRRPSHEAIDLDDLARRTDGLSAAAIAQLVEAAALAAFQEAAQGGQTVRITQGHLEDALARRGGQDRPTIENWSWDRLVLPPDVEQELRQLEALITDSETASRLGVEPPRGLLLHGPPGTGKTSIARVLAAQASCSFYPVAVSDVLSRWLGESEQQISRLFERARANRPSIVFIDEIDAVGSTRGGGADQSGDRVLAQLLIELDGMEAAEGAGVLVIGATNRIDQLDPALLRGGRLSRHLEIPLPDLDGRLQLLKLFTARMPTVGVDLANLAAATGGRSGADLESLCQQAAVEALMRTRAAGDSDASVEVLPADFERALERTATR